MFPPDGYPIASARIHLEEDVPAHSHDFCEIAIVVEGRLQHLTAQADRLLGPGDVVAIRPGAWHEYRQVSTADVCNLYVGPELFIADLDWVVRYRALTDLLLGTGEAAVRLDGAALGRVLGWLAQLQHGPRRIGPVGALQLRSLLGCTLAEFAIDAEIGPGQSDLLGRDVQSAIAAMASEPARPWAINQLAGLVAVSPSHLQHRFTEQLGMSPLRWLARHRAEQMALRLVGSDQTIGAIGAAVGWGDPNYASRRFRQEFAMTPSAYRARFRISRRAVSGSGR